MDKTMIMIFYAALTVALILLGYKFAGKIIGVSMNVGAIIGGVLGVVISVILWYTVGAAMVGK